MRYTVSAKELWINTSRLVKTKFLWHRKSAFKWEWITFADIRNYTWWDPWKRIDWRTTAKKWSLHVKEYEEERQLKIIVAQDCGKSMNFGLQSGSKNEQAQMVSSILAYAAASYGDQWGSLLFDDKPVHRMPPKKWMRSYFEAKERVKMYASDGHWSDVSWVVQFLLNNSVRHGLVFIVCDDFVNDCPWLRALTHYNDVVFVHCFDDYEMNMETEKKHGTLWVWSSARTMWFTKNTKIQYQQSFETKRSETQQYITKQWASYCLIRTSDDPVHSLVEFFMKKSHHKA